ncbi:uncharacterized protein LOC131858294 [Cryptomeria japonica]|uniref:uncharacterized protein LOC131858294 n=1 Tax=Cryptomeria japonica TaxID=3369 RepID=UPI0027DA3910|nr:uncharacterized protein LOC131858294 [Cryptomeria japonica]
MDDPVWINKVEALVGPFVAYILEGQKEAEWIEWKIVNLGYEILRSREQNVDWPSALCWHKMVLPKAGAFLWTALHGHILTGERLKLIGIAGPSVCILCKENEETTDHLLFWCSYTKRVWDWLLDKLQYGSVRSQSLKSFLLAWPTCYKKSKWSILWVVSLAMLAWNIWKERNRRVFNEEALPFELLIPKIKVAIEEVINVKVVGRKYFTYSSWDKEMERLWNLTKNSGYKFVDKK